MQKGAGAMNMSFVEVGKGHVMDRSEDEGLGTE